MTGDEYRYLMDLKSLDDIRLGMRWPSIAVRHPEVTQERLVERGWVRNEGDFVTLRTAGLRAIQRVWKGGEYTKS